MPFRVIAHRGASAAAPENTIPAFEKALELGVTDVELDIQLSRDDVLVVFHDRDLQAKTGVSGRVREHDALELVQLDIGAWFDEEHPASPVRYTGTRLATLGDVFRTLGNRLHYHVEIKAPEEAIPRRLLDEVAGAGLRSNVTITSFLQPSLERVRELDTAIPICLLVRDKKRLRRSAIEIGVFQDLRPSVLQRNRIDAAQRLGVQQVGFPAAELDACLVGYARDRGLDVRAWRVRSDDDVEQAITAGASGMTVDWPERALERIERRGSTGVVR